MAYFLAVTIGFVTCMAMLVGFVIYFLSLGLNPNDSIKVDKLE